MYKNNYGNCIQDDTGILKASSARRVEQQATISDTYKKGRVLLIELDFERIIQEKIEKIDEHLCAYAGSEIENKLIQKFTQAHKKNCTRCIEAFEENEKVDNDFLSMRSETSMIRKPCISTVNIIRVANEICELAHTNETEQSANTYESVLITTIDILDSDKLYTNTNFTSHGGSSAGLFSHKDEFIWKVVNEYLTLKSKLIGARISEESRGKYIRHSNKKRVHEAGQ